MTSEENAESDSKTPTGIVKEDECTVLPSFKRNNFFFGKLLTVNDFTSEQKYFVDKHRLLNRLLHGAGVVCGLKVLSTHEDQTIGEGNLKITRGVALDFVGREIVLPNDIQFPVTQKVVGEVTLATGDYYVYLKYASCYSDNVPKPLEGSTCQEQDCSSRITEGFVVSINNQLPNQEVPADNACDKWKAFVKNPEEYDFLLKDCTQCVDTGVVVLAKIAVTVKSNSVKVTNVDDSVGATVNNRNLVYNNECLFKLIDCLRLRADKTDAAFEALINDIKAKLDALKKDYQAADKALGDRIDALQALIQALNTIVQGLKPHTYPRITGVLEHLTTVNASGILVDLGDYPWQHDRTYWSIKDWVNACNGKIMLNFTDKMNKSTFTPDTINLFLELTAVTTIDYARKIAAYNFTEFQGAAAAQSGKITYIQRYALPVKIITKEDKAVTFSRAETIPNIETLLSDEEALKNWTTKDMNLRLKFIFEVKGDFIYSAENKCLDANFLRGPANTDNQRQGGVFESWFSINLPIVSDVFVFSEGFLRAIEAARITMPEVLETVRKADINLTEMAKMKPGDLVKALELPDGDVSMNLSNEFINTASTVENYRSIGEIDYQPMQLMIKDGIQSMDAINKMVSGTPETLATKYGVPAERVPAITKKISTVYHV